MPFAFGETEKQGTGASTPTESSLDEQRVPRKPLATRGTPRLGGDKVSAYITIPLHWTGDVSEVSAPVPARKTSPGLRPSTRGPH